MTTLAITPNWKNKTAKFKGTVAAGEHVSVTIQNDNGEGGEFISDASTLRLRVVDPCNGRTLAIFPEPVPEGETPETWDSDLSPLRCTLNLNTVQMLKAVPPAANVPLLWVLDDYDNNTLYFKEQFEVTHWPRLRGKEEPTKLDNYKDIIADFNTRLDGYGSRITAAENAAQAATENASAAAAKANQAVGIANQAVDKAETAQNSAAASAEAAHNSALAAEEAQEAAESAAESINSPDATLTEEGVAADAKATGDAIAAEKERAETAEAAEETRAKGVENGLRTDLTAAQKAIDDEAVLRAAADADLEARKADKTAVAAAIQAETSRAQTAERDLRADVSSAQTAISDRYTKSEVDAKIAGVQTFQKYLVQTLPDADEADMKGLYLVPTGETSEEGDLCEEWTVVEEDGEKRWEKIGGTTVDLSDYYNKDAVDNLLDDKQDTLTFDNAPTAGSDNPVKSGGIWSALWGALAALPAGFSSLYDWCVAQLAGKASNADATLTERGFSEWVWKGTPPTYEGKEVILRLEDYEFGPGDTRRYWVAYTVDGEQCSLIGDPATRDDDDTKTTVTVEIDGGSGYHTATRTALSGYTLGSQTDKPLASEAEAEALRAGKADKSTVDPLLFAQYYPDGNVKSAAEFTSDIKYDDPDTTNRTITVKPFLITDDSENDNSELVGRVVIPPFVDAQGNPYISDDGTRFRVLGVSGDFNPHGYNANLTAVIAPSTVTTIESGAFINCSALATISLPAATTIGDSVFHKCSSLTSVDFGDTPRSPVPSLGNSSFYDVPTTCKIIVPYTQYDEWIAADGWKDLPQEFVRHAEKADKPATFTPGNLAALDANGNPTDSQIPAADVALKGNIPYTLGTPIVIDAASSETVEGETVNYGAATLADRTANIVQVTAALDELRITFPAATSGKVRDFGLRVEIGTGSAALAAPALVPIAPTGETIKIENNAAEIPALADGTATAKGVTLLYFSENAPGVFVVKGEQVEEVL